MFQLIERVKILNNFYVYLEQKTFEPFFIKTCTRVKKWSKQKKTKKKEEKTKLYVYTQLHIEKMKKEYKAYSTFTHIT